MKTSWIIITALATAVGGQAWAVRVVGAAAPSADAVRQADVSGAKGAKAAQADDSSSMREGVITALSAKRDRVEINGSWLKLADRKTHLFRHGRAVTRDELAKGQKVKFTMAAGDAEHATLGAVYVP